MKRFLTPLAGALAALCLATGAAAQTPPIRLLVGFPAGGAPDAVGRQFAEALRKTGHPNVVIENRVGAAGKVAIDALLSGPTDGQTMLITPSSALLLVPMTVKSATYDAARDFVVVGNLAEYGFGIAAGPASGARTLAAFNAWVKANPTRAAYATPGLGTPQHFLGAELERATGANLTHVPYKGGALALTDVLSGQVPLLITTEGLLVQHHEAGKLTTLVVTSPTRNPRMPGVPTAREAGLLQFEARDWFGLFGRQGLNGERAAGWRRDIATAVEVPAYRASIEEMGFSMPVGQANLATRIEKERGAWAERVRLSGFKATD